MTGKTKLSVTMLLAIIFVAGHGQAAEPAKPATVKPKPAPIFTPAGGGASAASYARTVASDPTSTPPPATAQAAAEATVENPLYTSDTSTPVSVLHEQQSVAPAPTPTKSISVKSVKPKPTE